MNELGIRGLQKSILCFFIFFTKSKLYVAPIFWTISKMIFVNIINSFSYYLIAFCPNYEKLEKGILKIVQKYFGWIMMIVSFHFDQSYPLMSFLHFEMFQQYQSIKMLFSGNIVQMLVLLVGKWFDWKRTCADQQIHLPKSVWDM